MAGLCLPLYLADDEQVGGLCTVDVDSLLADQHRAVFGLQRMINRLNMPFATRGRHHSRLRAHVTHRGASASPSDLPTHITWECLIPKELVQISILERSFTIGIISVRYLLFYNAHTC
jgi:hypothetical protein